MQVILLMVITALAAIQQPVALADRQPPIPSALTRPEGIQPFDQLTIMVSGEPDVTNDYQVDAGGSISVPMIGLVPAAGFTAADFANELTAAFVKAYMSHPHVAVTITDSRHQTVFVVGEVRSPAAITMLGPISLGAALAVTGGPTSGADEKIVIVHPKASRATRPTRLDNPGAQITIVTIGGKKDGSSAVDRELQDGDTIYVLRAQR